MKRIALLALAASLAAPAVQAGSGRIAVFDPYFMDNSTEGAYNGVRADETERTARFGEQLRKAYEDAGYTLLDLAPVQKVIDRTVDPGNCNNCEIRMGETLEADYTVTSLVQKTSNLILTFAVVMREVASGRSVRLGSVSIRGNNDRSWEKGLSYLLRNNVLKDGGPEAEETAGGK